MDNPWTLGTPDGRFEPLDRDHFYDSIDEALTAIDAAGRDAAEV